MTDQYKFTGRVQECLQEINKVDRENIKKIRIERIAKKHDISITHIVEVGGWINKYYPQRILKL